MLCNNIIITTQLRHCCCWRPSVERHLAFVTLYAAVFSFITIKPSPESDFGEHTPVGCKEVRWPSTKDEE